MGALTFAVEDHAIAEFLVAYALTKADTGRGIVAGLCVAFIAIITDRLINAGVARSRQRLGLN